MQRALLPVVLLLATLGLACVHRPYYRDVVGPSANEKEIRVRLVNTDTNAAVPNVPINIGSGPDRIRTMTDSSGLAIIPVRKGLLDPFTVIEVVRPTGLDHYSLERVGASGPETSDAGM